VDRQRLVPGAAVTVEKREPAAEAVKIRIGKREEVSLGLVAAAKILVELPEGK
jgi:Fe2+ transport system protein FeoA